MIGPQILTVNPMRKRRHRRRNPESFAKRARAARKGWRARSHNRVHRRRHRNPESHRERVLAARRGAHHRRHRNPVESTMQEVTSMLVPAGIGAVSAVALDVIVAYLPLPTTIQTGWGNIAIKALGAVGLGVVAGMVAGKKNGLLVGAGALTVVGYDAVKAALAPTLGTSIKGLSGLADFADFNDVGVGAYMNQPGQIGAYMNPAAMLTGPAAAMPAATLRAKQVAGLRMGAYMPNAMGASGMM